MKKFNCSPKFDEPVKIPSRERVEQICKDLESSVVNQIFPVKLLIHTLGDYIADRFRVNVMHSTATEVEFGDVSINAYYDAEADEDCKIAIEIVLITNTNEKTILFEQEAYDRFVIALADSLAHELVHMKQNRARDFLYVDHKLASDEIEDELIYLSHPDEIDAYAYNIADELKVHPSPLKKLHNIKNVEISDSINLWAYVTAFEKDFKHPALKRLLKKIYKYLTR